MGGALVSVCSLVLATDASKMKVTFNLIKCDKLVSFFTQNLQGCAARFVYAFTATPSLPNPRNSTTSRLLRCFTLERKRGGQGDDESHDGSHDELSELEN